VAPPQAGGGGGEVTKEYKLLLGAASEVNAVDQHRRGVPEPGTGRNGRREPRALHPDGGPGFSD